MDIKPAAFTIIELVVAMAIVALLMAVGLPQLTGFSRQQDFASRAQKIVDCLQEGQQAAAQGLNGAEYVVVTLQNNEANTLCQQDDYGAWTKGTSPTRLTVATLGEDSLEDLATSLAHQSTTITDVQLERNYRIYFSAHNQGKPVLYASQDSGVWQKPESVSVPGDGVAKNIMVTDPHNPDTIQGVISINTFGSPITYEAQ